MTKRGGPPTRWPAASTCAKCSVPTLHPGDTLILDHLIPHQSAETLALIAQARAEVLFLPACSPEFNPIEKRWSKVKNHLRSSEARTLPELERAINGALPNVTAQDAQGWFSSCGYTLN